MTEERASKLVSVMLNATTADELFISMDASGTRTVQFAANRIMRAFTTSGVAIRVTIRKGQQYGSAVGSRLDDNGLRATVQAAEKQIGKLPSRDTIVPFQGTTTLQRAPIDFTQSVDDNWLMRQISTAIDLAKAKGLSATGILSIPQNTTILASSNGLFLYQPSTPAHFLIRILNAGGTSTGFRDEYSYDASKLDTSGVTGTAIDKCVAWENPQEIKAERITSVFEPQAFAEMLVPFMRQFDIGAYKAGRSFLTKLDGGSRLGESMFEEWVNIYSNPYHPVVPAVPFSPEGLPIEETKWVSKGVIHSAVTTRFEAEEDGTSPIPFPSNYIMDGGNDSLEQIIASTKKGLLVSGFAALEVEDPSNCLLSGSTRDGLFMIEDGKITGAIKNLIFRETPMYIIRRKEALGIQMKTSPRSGFLPMLVPSIRATEVMYERASGIV